VDSGAVKLFATSMHDAIALGCLRHQGKQVLDPVVNRAYMQKRVASGT
jgi:hypothetical protein